MKTMTLTECIAQAKRITRTTATLKDWRITRKIDRDLLALARELNAGKGYLLLTPAELVKATPATAHYLTHTAEDDRLHIWAVIANPPARGAKLLKGYVELSIIPVK